MITYIICFLLLFDSFISTNSVYLNNNYSNVSYYNLPITDLFTETYSYPTVGFGCSVQQDNNLYFVSSSNGNNHLSNENQKCNLAKKYVEIFKYDIENRNFTDSILIGKADQNYPKAIGNKGSPHVTTCGIDRAHNILYYIAANKYNCPSSYHTDSSIVRINLNTFDFIDRNIFKDFDNVETFATYSYYNYKYLNIPTTSYLFDNHSLWIGFGGSYTGIWKLDITKNKVLLLEQFQKSFEVYQNNEFSGDNSGQSYTDYFKEIKKSFFNPKTGYLYFLEDTGYRDAALLKVNYTQNLTNNNTQIISLDGINYISDIKIEPLLEKIYVVSGSLTSELYQFDFNLNKLKLNENCNIDFLKFPTEWGVITKLEVDYQTGFLYAIISNRHQQNGIVRIDSKNLEIDRSTHRLFGEDFSNQYYKYFSSYHSFNISSIILNKGIITILPNHMSYHKKLIIYDMFGCAKGRGLNNNQCSICQEGTFSNLVGGICLDCKPGYSSNIKEGLDCQKCVPGRFSNSLHNINCVACQAGYYIGEEGSDDCKPCKRGKYSIISGSDSLLNCLDCDEGSISFLGQTSCQICQLGKWAKNRKKCIDCSRGKYSSKLNIISDSDCELCPIGKYNDLEGLVYQSECKECFDGQIGIIEGAVSNSSCLECAAGKFKENLDTCTQCQDGWVSQEKSSECQMCDLGKWARDKKECISCPKGKYGSDLNIIKESECKTCMIGKYNPKQGMTIESDCLECPEGKIGIVTEAKTNKSCINCKAGKFKEGLDRCEICPSGWISGEKSDLCQICPEGTKSDLSRFSCTNCSQGMYNDFPGLTFEDLCKRCPEGKYSIEEGVYQIDKCKDCPIGKFNLDSGLISSELCKDCPIGKYRDISISSGQNCQNCLKGRFSYLGSSFCYICPPGKYSTDDSLEYCLDCPKGKYNKEDGKHLIEICINCVKGKWNNKESSVNTSYCISCDKGKYSDILGAISIDTCLDCEAGKYNDILAASSINFCRECSTGSYSIKSSYRCSMCPSGKHSANMGSTSCTNCVSGKYSKYQGSIVCDFCPKQSVENLEKTDCICAIGAYNKNKSGLNCIECISHFVCNKTGLKLETLPLKAHYWRESITSTTVYKCRNHLACQGGIIKNDTNDLCFEGHKGPICNICKKGWSKDDGFCVKCPEDNGRTLSFTILIPVICLLIIVFLIKTANPSNNKKEEVSGVVKIFMNYAQVFSLASSFQINWPSMIRYLFERVKEFSSPRVSFYSSDCVIGWSYYEKLIVYLALPLGYIICVTMIIGFISLIYSYKNKREDKTSCFNFFIAWEKTAIVVGTFLSWPTIIEKILDIMNCEKIGDKYYLVKDVSVTCYDETHYLFLIFGYIGLAIYGLGIPLMGFRLLYKYRYRLYDMQDRYDGSTPLAFLFLGYREKRWYYEFLIMGKKAGLILLSVFLRNYPRYQIIGASLLVQISFFLHVFLRPYDTITSYGMICNKLESISLLSLVMTLSTGLFFGTVDAGYQLGLFEDILIIILILVNGGITLYFLVYFIILTFKTTKTHIREHLQEYFEEDKMPCLLKCFSKNIKDNLKYWAFNEQIDNYGIHLKNELERQIFKNYFKQKQSKLEVINKKIDSLGNKRLSVKLDKLRSQVQVMEKQRCWQTIINNRLYNKLKKVIMLHKSNLSDQELNKLNEVFSLYINHGINYNEKMNDLYMNELKDMVPEEKKENKIINLEFHINDFETIKSIII